jgi:hypothetical protein
MKSNPARAQCKKSQQDRRSQSAAKIENFLDVPPGTFFQWNPRKRRGNSRFPLRGRALIAVRRPVT